MNSKVAIFIDYNFIYIYHLYIKQINVINGNITLDSNKYIPLYIKYFVSVFNSSFCVHVWLKTGIVLGSAGPN